jgi:hypothetical protein
VNLRCAFQEKLPSVKFKLGELIQNRVILAIKRTATFWNRKDGSAVHKGNT